MFTTINLLIVALTAASVFCMQAQHQVGRPPIAKGPKCTYPEVEIVSRQLFSANGQVVESPVSLTEYHKCDEQRREVESGELLNGEPDIKWISKYDENGNEIDREFWTHGSITSKSISRYDMLGRMSSQDYSDGTRVRCRNLRKQSWCRLLNEKGGTKKRWVITRDHQGREISKVESEPGRPRNRYDYRYDHRGNRTEESHYYRSDGKDLNSRLFLTFDEKGKLRERAWHDQTGLRSRQVYEYNERGDLTRRTEYNANKTPVEQLTIDYQSFDARGNWNKAVETKIRTDKGKITLEMRRVLNRIITYPKSPIALLHR